MTHFEPDPDSGQFRMETLMPYDTYQTINSMRYVGNGAFSEVIRQAIGVHMWYTECRAAGKVLLDRSTERLDPITMPEVDCSGEDAAKVSVLVNEESKQYLEPFSGEKDPTDLMRFWKEAIMFVGRLNDSLIMQRELLVIEPQTLDMKKVAYLGLFGDRDVNPDEFQPAESKWLRWRRKLI